MILLRSVISLSSLNGFDEFGKQLKGIAKKAKDLEGQQNVSFDVLFNDSFMRKHTSSNSFEEFLTQGGFVVNSADDFKNIPDEDFDAHVQKLTRFENWQSMIEEATGEYVAKQLGF
jgi:hypothetical protein